MTNHPTVPEPATLRVLIATGDRDLELRLVDGLPGEGIVVVARALDAATLLKRAAPGSPAVDAVLAASSLHGLGESTLLALHARRVPVLLLAADDREASRYEELAPALLASTPLLAIAAALRRTREGTPLAERREATAPSVRQGDEWDKPAPAGRVIAVTSGKGAPGKTTLAIAIAAALGEAGYSVVLVDADLRGGNVAPYLGLDPRRGLVGLAVAGGPLDTRLATELQEGPGCAVLAGVERPELAAALTPELVTGAVARLRGRYGRVVVDLGWPPEAGVLRAADHALLVTAPDLVSLWNARLSLRSLDEDGVRWGLAVNRREGREHYDGHEIERALGLLVLGTVREDRPAALRAIDRQVPLTSAGGRAAADLRALVRALEEVEAPDAAMVRAGAGTASVVVEASR
ncbi:MAG: P-loop NTPase [Dehalococcoidia bacterium]|nr:P-loop NTPase [Dehalococcoidia bacterium]MCA9850765.1 P-loop NTPase [Dehalococcoidia bacterium]